MLHLDYKFKKEKNYNESFEKAVELIEESKKLFVFVGGGIKSSNASDELKKFVELIDAPVTDSLMGKGAFDGKSRRYTGMLGMHGTKSSNLGVAECDLLMAIGTRFSDRVIGNSSGFASKAKIIHIDIDEADSYNGPFVMECMIQEDDKVFPMVAPGKSLEDTFDQDDL